MYKSESVQDMERWTLMAQNMDGTVGASLMNGLTFTEGAMVIGGSILFSLMIIEIIGAGVSMALLEITGSTVARTAIKESGGLLVRLLLRSVAIGG